MGENRGQNARTLFYLDGKRLRLQRPLDRDPNDLSSVIFQVMPTTINVRIKRLPLIMRRLEIILVFFLGHMYCFIDWEAKNNSSCGNNIRHKRQPTKICWHTIPSYSSGGKKC